MVQFQSWLDCRYVGRFVDSNQLYTRLNQGLEDKISRPYD